MSSASLTSLDFRRALGHFATGVTVVTVETQPGRVHGMTANSFTSVSLEPPLISVCVAERAHLLPLLKEKRVFGVNVLRQEQQNLSEFFAFADQPLKDEATLNVRFAWTEQRIPLMEGALCQIACRLHDTHVAGDHTIVVGEVLSAKFFTGEPLLYFRGNYTRLLP
jgi:3-hydroxy-9,10-secoandrosta-1,3,5(10)-triene-9,17-dione monooxygenase reductase component